MKPGEDEGSETGEAIHRVGGGDVENLRMKPAEMRLNPPGISVLKGGSPSDAARQIREAFPTATKLQELAKVIGSSTGRKIHDAGFDVMPDPTMRFLNHHRLTHPDGVAGFNNANLGRLSRAFTDSQTGE